MKIVRFNADGTLDSSFTSPFQPTQNSVTVYAVAVQADGKILLGGVFQILNQAGTVVIFDGIARLNSDGTPDTTFAGELIGLRGVLTLAIQPDGKILVGGSFSEPNNPKSYFLRLDANVVIDNAFNPNVFGNVRAIAVEPNGKILVGGNFQTVANQPRNRIARVNGDGSLDTNFIDPNADFNVHTIMRQPDGKILVGGQFANIGGQPRRLARLNSDGTLDASFNPIVTGSSATINDIELQSDGKIIFGGNFQFVNAVSRDRLARLNADGNLDTNFNPSSSQSVLSLALQTDGKLLAGGTFDFIGGQLRNRIARLTNDTPAVQTLVVMQTTVSLTISGAGPQLSRVRFESSTDGINYTFLGQATGTASLSGRLNESKMLLAPTATTFTLSGLNLPTAQNVFIRATGFDANGSEVTETGKNAVLAAPTASSVSITGRVVTPRQLGLTNALVTLTDSRGDSRTVSTSRRGSFRFADVQAGETYIISVNSKRYRFTPQVITVVEDLTDLMFTPQ